MSENQKKIDRIEASIKKIKEKKSNIYFLVQDTKGNPKAAVAHMYELCKLLNKKGHKASILHDNDYKGVGGWMDEEFTKLPHTSINTNFGVDAADMIVVPELMAFAMEQLATVPCVKVVLCQAYNYIFETLPAGNTWLDFHFDKCIATTEEVKKYILDFFPNVKVDVVSPFIPEIFGKSELPQKPIISVHSREHRDTLNIIKSFYIKYPQFRWITFRDLVSLSRSEFATALKESCLSVWVDNISSFGTFPLESMQCGVPVIGKIPDMIPAWMTDENGFWIQDHNEIIDHIAKYLQHWIEDRVPASLYEAMDATTTQFSEAKTEEQIADKIGFYLDKRIEAFENALNKLKEEEVTV